MLQGKHRVIYVPGCDRSVTVGQYVAAINRVKALPPETVWPHGLTTWASCTGAQIMRQFRAGMHDRISAGIPYNKRGF